MLIDNDKQAIKIIKQLKKFEDLTVDTETTGLKPFHGSRLCGIAVKGGDTKSYYFPFRHRQGQNLAMELLHNEMSDLLSCDGTNYIGFNYKFDLHILHADGISLPKKIEEVQCAAWLLNQNERRRGNTAEDKKTGYKLKYLAGKYIDESAWDESDVLIDKIITAKLTRSRETAKGYISYLSPGDVAPYACEDTDLTKALRNFYFPHLKEWELIPFYEKMNQYQLLLTKIEQRGIKVDVDLIEEYKKEAESKIEPTLKRLQEIAGFAINPGSTQQVKFFLKTDNVQKATIEEIAKDVSDDRSEFCELLLEYKGWSKVASTYYSTYLDRVDTDNILHPSLFIVGTKTGRLSCLDPNLQTLPAQTHIYKVKDVFVPRKGYVFAVIDYSQAELRLAAHHIEKFTEIFLKSDITDKQRDKYTIRNETSLRYALENGLDLHSETAKSMGLDPSDKIQRRIGKMVNFLKQYRGGPGKLAVSLKIPFKDACTFCNGFDKRFPGYILMQELAEQFARENGYLRLWNDAIRHFPDPDNTYHAASPLIQGGIGELIKEAQLRIDAEPRLNDCYQLLQVHDSIIIEMPDDDKIHYRLKIIKDLMEDFPELILKIPIDVQTGYNLSKLKTELEDNEV